MMTIGFSEIRREVLPEMATCASDPLAASAGATRLREVIAIPLHRVQAPDPGALPKARSRPRPRILVVEDHEDSRDMLRSSLGVGGLRCRGGCGRPARRRRPLARAPMVALIDLGLPVLDGFEVARAIRERLGQSLWLVALTSRTAAAPIGVGARKRASTCTWQSRWHSIGSGASLRDIVSRAS